MIFAIIREKENRLSEGLSKFEGGPHPASHQRPHQGSQQGAYQQGGQQGDRQGAYHQAHQAGHQGQQSDLAVFPPLQSLVSF